uniref:BTB domain-containing protein n=1 Tax=Anopheles funestus TaxID=62324 RepID=A0A4Y0BLY4_ANOFN
MDDDQQFCLRWNNHQSTLISVIDTLLENGTLVDCTLAAEGKFLKAHKVVLSACSPYFATLLSQQYDKHPIFILKDVKFQELRAMMDYMYRGEVNISQDQLAALLKAAESLQIKGLSDNRSSSSAGTGGGAQKGDATAVKSLQPPVPASKASGLTIENKRSLKSELHESDMSGSREGSSSPTSRKRKKVRRRSVDTNNLLIDNHDQHSNSSSHSMHTGSGANVAALAVTGTTAANVAASSLSSSSSTAAAGSNSSANVLSVAAVAAAAALKKTETVQQAAAETLKLQKQQQQAAAAAAAAAQSSDDDERCGGPGSVATGTEHDDGNDLSDNEHDGDGGSSVKSGSRHHHLRDGSRRGKMSTSSMGEMMIEPKSEYEDVQDENVEDLTMDDEDLMDELDQPGPSHGGDVSSQGYAQWPMEREQNEAFIAAQDAVGGQHRDAQGKRKVVILSSKRLAGGSLSEAGNGTTGNVTGAKKIKTITVTTSEPALLVDESDIPIITHHEEMRLRQPEREQQNEMLGNNVLCGTTASGTSAGTTMTITATLAEPSDGGDGATPATLITHATPVVLNDCLLESKNIVVTKKDNNYILFTADPDPSPEPPTSSSTGTTVMLPMRGATLVATGGGTTAAGNTTTATIIDAMRIEDLLKKEKIIKQTELHPDGTTATTYIFDECDILPIKTTTGTIAKGNVTLSPGTVGTAMVGKRVSTGNSSSPSGTVAGASIVNSAGTIVTTPVAIHKLDASPSELIVPTVMKSDGGVRKLTPHSTLGAPGKPLSHPRIKYSRAKNPYSTPANASITSTTITMPILTIPTVTPSHTNAGSNATVQLQEVSQQLVPSTTTTTTVTGTERQLLNFSLSRKLQPSQQHVTITGAGTPGLTAINASAIQQIPIAAISASARGSSVTTRYTVNEYETSGSNTSQSADFPPGMIDDLDYSVIEDIDLSDGVTANFSNVVAAAAAAATTLTSSGQQQQQQQQQQQTTGTTAMALVTGSKMSSDVDNNGSQSDDDDQDLMDEGGDDGSGDLGPDDDDDDEHITKYSTKMLKLKKDSGQPGGTKLLNASAGDSKFALLANPNIMRNFEYTVNESTVVSDTDDGEVRQYVCRHCGKRYRWKSTLRRHENVECGGKEASHQCPYCSYKAKQRGNLGVHIRKHHAEMPQLESRRRSNKSRHSM